MNAALYARYSSDNQREESIDAQVRAIRQWALQNGYNIVAEYTDEAKSATTDNRPGFPRMIDDSATADWSAVIVHKLDRFSRNRYDSAIYKRQLQRNGVKLISVLEHLDDSPESIILSSLLEGMSEYYSANLSREVMKGLRETAYQCRHTGGTPPLGYEVNPDRTYRIEPSESESVRIIFSMYAGGNGYADIINALKGRKTKTGKPFAKNSISDILRNEKYTGVFVFNKAAKKQPGGKRNSHATKNDEEIIRIPGGIPRIIDDDTWRIVQERLRDNKRNASNTAKQLYLLSGKLFCGKCGSAFVGKTAGSSRKPYYICGSRDRRTGCDMIKLPKQAMEDAVIEAIASVCTFDIDKAANEVLVLFRDKQEPAEVVAAKKRLREIDRQFDRLINAVMNGLDIPGIAEKTENLKEEKKRLEVIAAYKRTIPTFDEVRSSLAAIVNIKQADDVTKRQIIRNAVKKITVVDNGGSFIIEFNIFGDKRNDAPPFVKGSAPMVEAGRTHPCATFSLKFSRQRSQRC